MPEDVAKKASALEKEAAKDVEKLKKKLAAKKAPAKKTTAKKATAKKAPAKAKAKA